MIFPWGNIAHGVNPALRLRSVTGLLRSVTGLLRSVTGFAVAERWLLSVAEVSRSARDSAFISQIFPVTERWLLSVAEVSRSARDSAFISQIFRSLSDGY